MADHLFSYGTLQFASVQQAQFGRLLEGSADMLVGWRREMVEITDPAVLALSGERFHPILRETGDPADTVAGTVLTLTAAELAAADRYEVEDYRRIEVTLRSGCRAWVYVGRDDTPPAPVTTPPSER